jgi:pyridoxal phosphate enzyme (YggS family)
MSPIESNLQHVHSQIDAAIAAVTPSMQKPVTLVAVSKTKPAEDVREAFEAGQREFGENYVQEALVKINLLSELRRRGLIWHFIGPLQSNKLKSVAANFDWVHGVDRLKVAATLSRHRTALSPGQNALNVCVQVNVSGETSKGGVAPKDALALATEVSLLPSLKLRGLMTIIEDTDDEATQRAQFCKMRTLFESLRSNGMGVDTLSMGMSQDFAIAIAEGATMLRIGSAIFGARQ